MTFAVRTLPLVIALALTAPQETMKLTDVLVMDVAVLKPGADAGVFETQAAAVAPLFLADRGGRKGQYLLVRPNARTPLPDLSRFTNGGLEQIEYRLVGPQSAGALPDLEILGVHYIKVRPDRRDDFNKFVAARLHPAVGQLRPDLRLLYYQCVRGADVGHYITVFALTRASRDKYWPKGSDSDDVREAFRPVRALTPELIPYLVEGSYLTGDNFAAAVFESREWTDFVRVVPQR